MMPQKSPRSFYLRTTVLFSFLTASLVFAVPLLQRELRDAELAENNGTTIVWDDNTRRRIEATLENDSDLPIRPNGDSSPELTKDNGTTVIWEEDMRQETDSTWDGDLSSPIHPTQSTDAKVRNRDGTTVIWDDNMDVASSVPSTPDTDSDATSTDGTVIIWDDQARRTWSATSEEGQHAAFSSSLDAKAEQAEDDGTTVLRDHGISPRHEPSEVSMDSETSVIWDNGDDLRSADRPSLPEFGHSVSADEDKVTPGFQSNIEKGFESDLVARDSETRKFGHHEKLGPKQSLLESTEHGIVPYELIFNAVDGDGIVPYGQATSAEGDGIVPYELAPRSDVGDSDVEDQTFGLYQDATAFSDDDEGVVPWD